MQCRFAVIYGPPCRTREDEPHADDELQEVQEEALLLHVQGSCHITVEPWDRLLHARSGILFTLRVFHFFDP